MMHVTGTYRPIEALANLRQAIALIAAGQPLPPLLRAWLVLAFRQRAVDPKANLDRLLGLRSRAAGRLSAFSKNPQRDRAIRALVGNDGSVESRAVALADRVKIHRKIPDHDLAALEKEHGRIPTSRAQLVRIIAGHTRASQIDA